jgi:hypothetical protein
MDQQIEILKEFMEPHVRLEAKRQVCVRNPPNKQALKCLFLCQIEQPARLVVADQLVAQFLQVFSFLSSAAETMPAVDYLRASGVIG